MTSPVYAFGGFRLDAARRLLFDPQGAQVALSSRALELLVVFVEHPHQLLSKQALLSKVWPDAVVEENNLNQCVFALRRALGEKPGEHRFIVTVPGRGYRFVATVTPVEPEGDAAAAADATDAAAPAPAADLPAIPPQELPDWRVRLLLFLGLVGLAAVIGLLSDRGEARMAALLDARERSPAIAVLPLADLGPDRDAGEFALGLSGAVLDRLGDNGFVVISRTSSFAFQGRHVDVRRLGRQLGADFVVEGSVRRTPERVRVDAQLVETQRGTRIWSRGFDRANGDPLVAQEEIARDLADALAGYLRGERELAGQPR